eukprot:1020559-Rhodomonas_salina.1
MEIQEHWKRYCQGGGEVSSAIGLRACYAMSGTDILYGRICLRACYAVSGTEIAWVPGVLGKESGLG